MAIPILQMNLPAALQNLPNQFLDGVSTIATRVTIAVMAARLGHWLAKMGLSQVCPEFHLTCREPADSIRDRTALVDPENPPFGWKTDLSKALVDPANPPLGWQSPTQLCNRDLSLNPQSNFCESIYSGMDIAEEIVNTVSRKVNSIRGSVFFLKALNVLVMVFNRIARRV